MNSIREEMWAKLTDDEKRHDAVLSLVDTLYWVAKDAGFRWAVERKHDGLRALFNKNVAPAAGGDRNLIRTVADLTDRFNAVGYSRVESIETKRFVVTMPAGLDPTKLSNGSLQSFWAEAVPVAQACIERLQAAEDRKKTIIRNEYNPDLQQHLLEELREAIGLGTGLFPPAPAT